jgi:hypothetical protein
VRTCLQVLAQCCWSLASSVRAGCWLAATLQSTDCSQLLTTQRRPYSVADSWPQQHMAWTLCQELAGDPIASPSCAR